MTSHAGSASLTTELQVIDALRTRYENEGFDFVSHPGAEELPAFLGAYSPDAVARKPGRNIAFQIKQRRSLSTEHALTQIRRLFDGHSDWQFRVVFSGSDLDQATVIAAGTPEVIHSRLDEIRILAAQGHRRAAFVYAWSLLEASLRIRTPEEADRPVTPGTVVQALAMNGAIEPETERDLRALIELRNRIVHGDLVADPSQAEIGSLLQAIEEALRADAP